MASLPLSTTHMHMLRDESGIALELIQERGYRSIDGVQGYAELKALGFAPAPVQGCRLKSGLVNILAWIFGFSPNLTITLCRVVHWTWRGFKEA